MPVATRAGVAAVLLPVTLVGLTAAVILPTPLTTGAREIQHAQSLALQVLAAALAAALAWRAASVGPMPARTFWRRAALGAVLSASALVVHAISALGRGALWYASIADVLFLLAVGLLVAALVGVRASPARLPWVVGGVVWVAVAVFLWPAILAPTGRPAVALNLLHATAAAALFALAVAKAIDGPRASARGTWIGVAAAAALVLVDRGGAIYLRWLGLLSDVHPIVLARVGVFGLLAGSAVWHHDVDEALTTARAAAPPKEWVWPPARASFWERVGPVITSREMLVLASASLLAVLVWLARIGAGPVPTRRVPAPAAVPRTPAVVRTPAVSRTPTVARTPVATPAPPTPAPAVTPQPPGALPAPPRATPLPAHIRERHEAAVRLLEAGRPREAQDEYLTIILAYRGADDAGAMRGLVAVRRRLANDDPAVLRRQAQVYRRAIALKIETEEHYTSQAMEVLARACELAAKEIESRRDTTR
jgi:hypothetical protein